MEDENGREISDSVKDSVRKTARGFFELLLENGRAPDHWSNAPIDIENEYLYIMGTAHPFLRLCQNHWKATKVATNSYSQWLSNALNRTKNAVDKAANKKAKETVNNEAIDIDSDEGTDGKASSQSQDNEEQNLRPSKRSRIQENHPTPTPRPHSTNINPRRQKVCK